MLKKRERLTRSAFTRYFKEGARSHSASLQLIYVPGAAFHGAVVVGKKVAKRAVDRNRLRRRIYGRLYALRQHRSLSGTFIFIAKPGALTLAGSALSAEVADTVGRALEKR